MEAISRMALVGAGERLDAARAHALGIVSEVVAGVAALRPRAQQLAETIAQQDPHLLATVKRALWAALEGSPEATPHNNRDIQQPGGAGPERPGPKGRERR